MWCLLLSHHQADTDRFAEIAQSDSLQGWSPRGMRRCAGLQSSTGSEHTTESWQRGRFALLMCQEDKASVKHWYHHTACHFLGLDHTHLSLLWVVLQCHYALQLYLSGTELLQVLQQQLCFPWAVGRVASQVRPRMNQIQLSNWIKFLSRNYWGKSRATFKEESLVLD